MSPRPKASIDAIRGAFLRVHRAAIGEADYGYMSIPADHSRDADLIVSDAIDELAALRIEVERLREGHVDLSAESLHRAESHAIDPRPTLWVSTPTRAELVESALASLGAKEEA